MAKMNKPGYRPYIDIITKPVPSQGARIQPVEARPFEKGMDEGAKHRAAKKGRKPTMGIPKPPMQRKPKQGAKPVTKEFGKR